jgi:predicted dehydrogenase
MNRRDFTKLSALTLASTQLPAQTAKPIGYAAIGLGTISDIFMRACAQSTTSKVTALVTGHPETKGRKYAAMYNIPESSIYTYETFDKIRSNPEVDAVYVGLPNSMHCEYTLRAAAAGKHVLCEKPMAISSAECRKMIDACRNASRKLMIAYRVHYDPTWSRFIEIVNSNALGTIKSFQGSFCANMSPNQWRLDRKLAGGGSIMDLGIYPLNAIRYITGEEPVAYTAVASTRDHASGRFATIEESIEWTMKFPSGIIASCGSSYGTSSPGFLQASGERGFLQMVKAYNYDGFSFNGRAGTQNFDEASAGKLPFQFVFEADHFSACIRNNTQPKTPGEEGLKDLLAIEAIYKAAGIPIA